MTNKIQILDFTMFNSPPSFSVLNKVANMHVFFMTSKVTN